MAAAGLIADGADRELSPLGAHRGLPLPAGPCLVCDRFHAASRGRGRSCTTLWFPAIPAGGLTPDLMFLVIAIVGTTIAPWQLFFQQSCIADKRLRFADLKWARLDTFIGRLHSPSSLPAA